MTNAVSLRRTALVLALCVGALLFSAVATKQAVGSTPPSYSWCISNSAFCVWAQTNMVGAGDYWFGSDSSWHSGIGTNVADDDDSYVNYSGLWVKVFHDVNLGGSCEWIAGHGTQDQRLGNNDDGSSHQRYTSKPSC